MSVIADVIDNLLRSLAIFFRKLCDPTWQPLQQQQSQSQQQQQEQDGKDGGDAVTVVDYDEANLTSDFTKLAFERSGDSLRLCAYYVCLYILVAVVAFSCVFEKWTVVDSMYFAVTCFTTIGYGDLVPTSMWGRVFTSCFALFGIVILGIFLGIVGHSLAAIQEERLAHVEKKTQDQVLGLVSDEHLERSMENTRLEKERRRSTLSRSILGRSGSSRSNSSGSSRSIVRRGSDILKSLLIPDHRSSELHALNAIEEGEEENGTNNNNNNNNDVEEEDDEEDTNIIDDVAEVFRAVGPILALLIITMVVLGFVCQGWDVVKSIYFCVISFSTIGFGDVTAKSQVLRLFMVFFLPVGVATFGEMLSRIAAVYIDRKNRVARKKFLQRSLTLCDIESMDEDNNGDVSREEFVSFMLVALQKVTEADIAELRRVFHSLDVDSSGTINKQDLVVMAQRRKEQDHVIQRILGEEQDETPYGSMDDNTTGGRSTSMPGNRSSRFNTVHYQGRSLILS